MDTIIVNYSSGLDGSIIYSQANNATISLMNGIFDGK